MTRLRRRVAAGMALALAVLVAPVTTASAAAEVRVRPDVAALPAGALPRLPYVDWSAKRIVDGSRRVSIAGIQGRVISLHKVDGGYLLGRELTTGNDLVFVSTGGARRVLVAGWQAPRRAALEAGLAVSRHGDKVLVNTRKPSGGATSYVDTRVLSLPGGTLLRKRDFGAYPPRLLGYGIDRALLTVSSEEVDPPPDFYPDTRWWNPSADVVTAMRQDAAGESADLSAWEWAVRPGPGFGSYSVQGIPPESSPSWAVSQEDVVLGPWSPDDTMIAGNSEVTDPYSEAVAYLVHRTSDGRLLLSVDGNQDPQITWESDSALLLRTRIEDPDPDAALRYQLIRCSLSGACERVGPRTTDRRGVIIPATRRNS